MGLQHGMGTFEEQRRVRMAVAVFLAGLPAGHLLILEDAAKQAGISANQLILWALVDIVERYQMQARTRT